VSRNSIKLPTGWLTPGRCAAAGGARTAFDDRRGGEGPGELLSTYFLSLSELVFETLPLEILSFLTRTPSSPKPSPLPPSLNARAARALASVAQASPAGHSLCLSLQSTLAALQAGAPSRRGFRRTLVLPPYSLSAPPPPSVTLSFLSPVLFCLPLPGPALELEAGAASSVRLSCLLLLRPASIAERGWRFGQGQTIRLCLYLQFLHVVGQAEDEG
jgi:hypothetical protein